MGEERSGRLVLVARGMGRLRAAALAGSLAMAGQVFLWAYGVGSLYSRLLRVAVDSGGSGGGPKVQDVAAVFEGVIYYIVAGVIIATVLAVAYYYLFRGAARVLGEVEQGLGLGATGGLLGIAGYLLMAPGALLLIYGIYKALETGTPEPVVSALLVGSLLGLTGALLSFIGDLLVSVFLLRVGDVAPGGGSWSLAGLLYLVGVILAAALPSHLKVVGYVLGLVALLLAYHYAGKALVAIEAGEVDASES